VSAPIEGRLEKPRRVACAHRRRSLTVRSVTLAAEVPLDPPTALNGKSELYGSVRHVLDTWMGEGVPKPHSSGETLEGFWRLYQGDCHKVLKKLPAKSVNCVVTSPPYYWQRDYQVDGQFGMEATIDGFVNNLRKTFRALWNVLADDGTVWLNLGDTYYSAKGKPHGTDAKHRGRRLPGLRAVDGPGLGLPRKSMIGMPWRVALGMQKDGWTLRSAIVWTRETALGEPTAKDRPHRKYEHIFLFSKKPRYYFNRAGLNGEEDVWVIEPERNSESRGSHYAPYPRQLVERCIDAGCPQGGVVLDPFLGGGTTMSVAVAKGRSAVGVELNSQFCDLVAKRMPQVAQRTMEQPALLGIEEVS
jgi:DNA modification methylase